MNIERETTSYNDRRYGKPWIALVDFSAGARGEFQFGEWCGQAGEAGTLYLEAGEGSVVAIGQKDHRKSANSAPEFFLIRGGKLEPKSKAEAYKAWRAEQTQGRETNPLAIYSDEEIAAEHRRRGLAR